MSELIRPQSSPLVPPGYRIGCDVGGTFTDLVLLEPGGALTATKLSSTTGNYQVAVISGIEQLLKKRGVPAAQVSEVLHGTTAATNAVLERTGAMTGLITTKGFRDVLELRRLRMPDLYNVFWNKPSPLVPRNFRKEVSERVDGRGRIITPLELDEVRDVVRHLIEQGTESLAVCLLHSYLNPVHERQIGELVRREFPGLCLSLSSDVIPEIGEYERTSTIVANAYVMPVMAEYLRSLRHALDERAISAPLLIVQSSGGMMTSHMAMQRPVYSLESGPAAGVNAANALLRRIGISNAITFDMGGTTAKAALIEDGEAQRAPEYEIGAPISVASRLLKGGGYLLRVRAVDLAEVGAGGGSIVSVDKGGAVQVGPRSAGAMPGPACYGRGGAEATVTDANVVLGYLNPEHLLGGELKLDLNRAAHAVSEQVSTPLGLPLLEAAYAVHIISNATMARAIRAVSTEQGRDVRNFQLVAFGGNGPVHAAELARSLGINRVLIPPAPGLFSALGLLASPLEQEALRTVMRLTSNLSHDDIEHLYKELEDEVAQALRLEGVDLDAVSYRRFADMRYADQVHQLSIALADGFTKDPVRQLEESFGREHERTYGHRSNAEPVEVVNVRLVGRFTLSRDEALPQPISAPRRQLSGTRRAYFGRERGLLEVSILGRADLTRSPTAGPLIVEEFDTTVIVPPSFSVRVDEYANLILEIKTSHTASPQGER